MKDIHYQEKDILSREKAIEVLRPYFSKVHECIAAGWDSWEQFGEREPLLRKPLKRRTRASFVHDHTIEAAHRSFDGIPGIHLSEQKGYLTLVFGNNVILRFKKFDRNLRTSGISTRQYELFRLQQSLDGFELVHLIAGYRLNDLQTDIRDILVACPIGLANKWIFEISTTPEAVVPEIVRQIEEKAPVVIPVGVKIDKKKSEKAS